MRPCNGRSILRSRRETIEVVEVSEIVVTAETAVGATAALAGVPARTAAAAIAVRRGAICRRPSTLRRRMRVRPRESQPYEPPAATDFEPIILPGESLSIFKDRAPSASTGGAAERSSFSTQAPPAPSAQRSYSDEEISAGLPGALFATPPPARADEHESEAPEAFTESFVSAPEYAAASPDARTEIARDLDELDPEAEPAILSDAQVSSGGSLSDEDVSSLAEQLAEAKHEEARGEAEARVEAAEAVAETFVEPAELEELQEALDSDEEENAEADDQRTRPTKPMPLRTKCMTKLSLPRLLPNMARNTAKRTRIFTPRDTRKNTPTGMPADKVLNRALNTARNTAMNMATATSTFTPKGTANCRPRLPAKGRNSSMRRRERSIPASRSRPPAPAFPGSRAPASSVPCAAEAVRNAEAAAPADARTRRRSTGTRVTNSTAARS